MTISVVIPALNEAAGLRATLACVAGVPEVTEVIISDGGSCDDTVSLARAVGARVVSGPRGRGGQLRRGADLAKGDVVLLLHADTWLPPNAGVAIQRVFEGAVDGASVVGGAFLKEFRDPPWLTRGSRLRCRWRMALFQFAYGDQGIFVLREALIRAGGVPDLPLMEEHYLCAALRRLGRLKLADATVSTSARRFRQRGFVRTYLRMAGVTARHWMGATPEQLRALYESD